MTCPHECGCSSPVHGCKPIRPAPDDRDSLALCRPVNRITKLARLALDSRLRRWRLARAHAVPLSVDRSCAVISGDIGSGSMCWRPGGLPPRFLEDKRRMAECTSMACWDIQAGGDEWELRIESAEKPAAGRMRRLGMRPAVGPLLRGGLWSADAGWVEHHLSRSTKARSLPMWTRAGRSFRASSEGKRFQSPSIGSITRPWAGEAAIRPGRSRVRRASKPK